MFLVTVTAANYVSPFTITNTKFYIPAVFLSTQGNDTNKTTKIRF